MNEHPDGQARRFETREELILSAAVEAFGRNGYAGASLRNIAAAAGVSLSLLSHHFQSKQGLLEAVAKSLYAMSAVHLPVLRDSLERASQPQDVVVAWVRYGRDTFGTRQGFPFLRLMLRLQSDSEVADDVRTSLDASETHVKRKIRQLFPAATAEAEGLAWTASSGALHATLVEAAGQADAIKPSRTAALEHFLAAGLRDLFTHSSPGPDAAASVFTSEDSVV